MNLKLSFYQSGTAPLPSGSTDDQGKIVFDQVNDRIGANNFWFGSTYAKTSELNNYLPLSGGTMTGPINLNGQGIKINSTTSEYNNQTQYRYAISWIRRNNADAIEVGNPYMNLRLATGQNGKLTHYYRNVNTNPVTEYEATILDTYNSTLTSTNYGYTLNLGGTSQNLLGIGQLSPSLSVTTVNNQPTLSLSVGGETCSTVISSASTAGTAGSAAALTGNHYFTLNTENYESGSIEEDNYEAGTRDVPEIIYVLPGSNSSPNKSVNKLIIDTDYLKIVKVPAEGYNSVTPNDYRSYNLKITLSDAIIQRIEALEARSEVTYTIE